MPNLDGMNNVPDVVDLCRSPRSPPRSAKRHKIADVHFPRPKSHSFTDPPLKLPPAGDGFEAGANVKTDEEATLLSNLFKDCGSDRKFSVGDRRPSYPDYDSIKGPLEALHRDRKCGKRQFLDRQGHKWSVKYDVGAQRASLVNEEARTVYCVPSSNTFTLHVQDAHTTPAPATTFIEERALARPSTRLRLKTRLVQTSDTKLPLAGDGSKPGPVIKSEAAAAAWNCVFERCRSDLRFAVGKPGPSYDQALAIKASLKALDRDRNCSNQQFLDRQDRKWSVMYSNKRACLIDQEARTPCSVPSSTHIHTFTSATHIRGPLPPRSQWKRSKRIPRHTFALKTTRLVQNSNPKLPLAGDGSEPGPVIKAADEASAWTTCFQRYGVPRTFAVGDRGPSFKDIQPLLSKLAALGSDSDRSTRSFVDSEGRRWVVKLRFSDKRAPSLKAVGTSSGVLYSFTHVPCMYVRAFTVQNTKSNFAPTLP